MKLFFDTEFIEWAGGVDLVSIGIVTDRGDSFYGETANFDERNADNWVKENVLSKLEYWGNEENFSKGFCNVSTQVQSGGTFSTRVFGTDKLLAEAVQDWINKIVEITKDEEELEFYAYYGAYDWVIFARLFGRLIDLPSGFPMWVRDLKQMMWERGLDGDWKKEHCPDLEGEHNALVDAKWNKKLYKEIMKHSLKS